MHKFSALSRQIGAILPLSALALSLAFPGAGFAAPPEGEELPPPPPLAQLAFTPGNYDFGLQRINSGGSDEGFQLTNSGEAGVQVNNVDIAGPSSNVFWVDNGGCNGRWLNPGESCPLQVHFGPQEPVSYSAQLRASVNGASFTADLAGRGGQAVVSGTPNPVDFGAATVGASGSTRTIVLTNSGNLSAGYFVGIVAGGDAGSFRLLDTSCVGVPLPAGGSCVSHVRFAPVSPGAKTAALSFFGEAEGGTEVVLSGEGVGPAATLTPPASDFGTRAVGTKSGGRWLELRNDGETFLEIDTAAIVGPDLDQFALAGDTCTGTTLGPGQECLLKVRFTPDSSGAKTATLRVTGDGTAFSSTLYGHAIPARRANARTAPRRHRLRHHLRRGKAIEAVRHR